MRDAKAEAETRAFLAKWGPEIAEDAGNATPPDFAAQCEAVVAARPAVVSSIMGLFPEKTVRAFKDAGIAWFATATTLAEARAAQGRPARTRSSRKVSKQAAIAAHSRTRMPSAS